VASELPRVTVPSPVMPRIIKKCLVAKHRWLWQFMKELLERKVRTFYASLDLFL
jgi:hypothetical protein